MDDYLHSASPSLPRDTWEKKPILVQRKNPNYYKGLFSTAEFDRILRQVPLCNILLCSVFSVYVISETKA